MGRTSVLVSIIFLILSSFSVNAFQRIDGSLYVTANVGIGTSLPRSALDMSNGCITLGNDTQCTWPAGSQWVDDTNGIHYSAGNVGIGADSDATKKLYINGEVAIPVDSSIYLDGTSGDTSVKYNSSSAYFEMWTDGTKRIEF